MKVSSPTLLVCWLVESLSFGIGFGIPEQRKEHM